MDKIYLLKLLRQFHEADGITSLMKIDECFISWLKEYQKVLQKANVLYQKRSLENIYRELYPGRKQLVEPLVKPIEDIIDEFEKTEYEGKAFDRENTTEFYTIKPRRNLFLCLFP